MSGFVMSSHSPFSGLQPNPNLIPLPALQRFLGIPFPDGYFQEISTPNQSQQLTLSRFPIALSQSSDDPMPYRNQYWPPLCKTVQVLSTDIRNDIPKNIHVRYFSDKVGFDNPGFSHIELHPRPDPMPQHFRL